MRWTRPEDVSEVTFTNVSLLGDGPIIGVGLGDTKVIGLRPGYTFAPPCGCVGAIWIELGQGGPFRATCQREVSGLIKVLVSEDRSDEKACSWWGLHSAIICGGGGVLRALNGNTFEEEQWMSEVRGKFSK